MQRLQELLNGEFSDVVRCMQFVNFSGGESSYENDANGVLDMRSFSRISVEECRRFLIASKDATHLKIVNVLNIHLQFIFTLVNSTPNLRHLELIPDTTTFVEIEDAGAIEYVSGNITIKSIETTFKSVLHKTMVVYQSRKTYTWIFGETRKARKLRLRCEAMLAKLKEDVMFTDVEKLHLQLSRIVKK